MEYYDAYDDLVDLLDDDVAYDLCSCGAVARKDLFGCVNAIFL